MNILIYEYRAGGHYIEFVNHVIEFLINNNKSTNNYLLFIPFNFKQYFFENLEKIKSLSNVKVIETDFDISIKYQKANYLKKIYLEFSMFKKLIKNNDIDEVYLLTMESLSIPLTLWRSSKIKISGILIHPFVRLPKSNISSAIKFYIRYLQLYLLNRNNAINKIFILNDLFSSTLLNHIFRSNKFNYIPDPILPGNKKEINVASKYYIQDNEFDLIILHAGSLDDRKATLETISSLNYASFKEYQKGLLIVAGKSSDNFNNLIIDRISENKSHFEIRYFREFLSYEVLCYFFSKCHIVVAAYKNFPFSSGILNHAISNMKKIIVTKYGLMGDLVSKNNFGITIETCSIKDIADGINSLLRSKKETKDKSYFKYIDEHSSNKFSLTFLN